jgi:disulfide bond formation protein DsbB
MHLRQFTKYGREIAFFVALLATVGSLLTSQVFGWNPCTLCILQRVLMFPLVLILGWILFYDTGVSWYLLIIPFVGGGVSLYHHLLVRFDPTQDCGFALPCVTEYGFYIGSVGVQPMYVPFMASVAFVIIAISLVLYNCFHG